MSKAIMGFSSHYAACIHHTVTMDLFLIVVCGFVGLWTARRVHSAFHAPLMGLTNAMSSIVAVLAVSLYRKASYGLSWGVKVLLLTALFLLIVNAVGGLLITYRMLNQFGSSSSSPASSS